MDQREAVLNIHYNHNLQEIQHPDSVESKVNTRVKEKRPRIFFFLSDTSRFGLLPISRKLTKTFNNFNMHLSS